MTNLLQALQLAIISFFTAFFLLQQIGAAGRFRLAFLQNEIYPATRRISALLTDLKFRCRGSRPPSNKIVIVEVDSGSIEDLGHWPWRRDLLAYLVDKTFQAGARAVGMDIIFADAEQRIPEELETILERKGLSRLISQFDTDHVLSKVVETHSDRTVLSWMTESECRPLFLPINDCPVLAPAALATQPPELSKFAFSQIHLPWDFDPRKSPLPSAPTIISNLPELNLVSEHQGFVNSFPDQDGVIRRAALLMLIGGKPYPSLPLEVARVARGDSLSTEIGQNGQVTNISFIREGRELPANGSGSIEVNFRGPARTFTYLSAEDVLRDDDTIRDEASKKLTGMSKKALLKEAVVLIGVSALALGDVRATPFESHMPGVEVQATILDNLLSGDPLEAATQSTGFLVLLFLVTAGAFFFGRFAENAEAKQVVWLFAVTLGALFFFDTRLFAANRNWDTSALYLELTALAFATLFAKYTREERKKKFLRLAFSKYVAPAVVDTLLRDPALLSLGGRKKNLTVLFSDIRDFTTLSEHMDPKDVSEFLNEYFGLMTEIVFQNGGTLDKYIGDALMAFWGAPIDDPKHASRASQAARAMQTTLAAHREKLRQRFGVDVHIGIGVHSGTASVGNMGSQKSFGYTAIGDDVNLASRLETATKIYNVRILTSRATIDAISREGGTLPLHRVIDAVKVKGRAQLIEIIEVLEGEASPEGLKRFQEGRDLYRARQWEQAEEAFSAADRLFAAASGHGDGPSRVFLERCRRLSHHPPPPDWDGSWDLRGH